ncbi:MAG: sigma-70 family RNA polymerase sigma factor [Actinomycetota bacterium]|nr:sigma-70 family RNA polymerase sigma factor [Actinomycetota bacterium]
MLEDVVADAHRREWGFVLAATVRVTRDLDLAEECAQDAFAKALVEWRRGIPSRPGAWLTTVARNRALDLLRRDATLRRALPLLVQDEQASAEDDSPHLSDERLRLIFTCCHPALASEAQVALTLRLLCGLSTAEVARAFLVAEPTMAARITRAKKKIASAGIPYQVPEEHELGERLDGVLATLHLLFTTGHTAPQGDQLVRDDLVLRSLELVRMLHSLLPQPEVSGLLALIVLTHARRATRVDDSGRLVLLADQDRTKWDRAAVSEGVALVRSALLSGPPGRYTLQAAIAAVHAEAAAYEQTDWREIAGLYLLLERHWSTPVVALNRAVAIGMAFGPQRGLAALDALGGEPSLAGYGYLPAARADFLRRLGDVEGARQAYEQALGVTANATERAFLNERLTALDSPSAAE